MSTEPDSSDRAVGQKAEKAKHPLMEFVPAFFQSFEEWLARWQGTNILTEKLGLLHCFAAEERWWEGRPEMVSFFLEVADGHERAHCFLDGSEYYHREEIARNRQEIAKKAFAALCLRFFKSGDGHEDPPLWWWALKNEALFKKVFWFLRFDQFGNMHNLRFGVSDKPDHHQQIFEKFLRDFARLGWEFHSLSCRYDRSDDETVEKRIIAARPQFMDILVELKMLNWLNGQELDAASLKKLGELALGAEYHLPPRNVSDHGNRRRPENLKEAVLGGSVAAQVLILHSIRRKEERRIKALYDASVLQNQEAQRLRRLHELEKQREELAREAEKLKK